MAKHSLEYSSFSLNHPLDPYDFFTQYLDRAYALVSVALSEDFMECEQLVIHSYLSLLADLISNIRQSFEVIWKQLAVNEIKE